MDLVLATRGFDHSDLSLGTLRWHLPFYVLIVLVLTILVFRALCLNNASRLTLVVFEVVGESGALGRLMLLLERGIILLTLSWNAGELLLRLTHSNSLAHESRLILLIPVVAGRVASDEPYLLVLILVVLDSQLRLGGVDLVAFLADALGGDVVALLFAFFSFTRRNLQMPGYKS